jgi:hypothetical protein
MGRSDGEDRYRSEAVLRAREVLRAFKLTGETLLRDLVSRTVFRLLHNLEQGGLIERTATEQHRTTIKPVHRRKVRVGCAGESLHSASSREVTEGLRQAANEEGIDIVPLDNQRSHAVPVRNAEKLIQGSSGSGNRISTA